MIEAPVSSFDTGAAIEIRGSTDALRHALERDALAEQPATAIGKIRRIERRIGGPRETRAKGHRRSEEHTSELQSRLHLVCRLLLEKKNNLEYDDRCSRQRST